MGKFSNIDDAAQHPKSDWKQQVSSAAEQAQTEAAGMIEPLKEQAREAAEQQKAAGAEQIGSVARAVHGAAGELEKELPHAARYIHDAADRIESAAATLRERNVDDLFRSVSEFARNQPATFFGSAVFAGFALSRFLKSSAGKQG
jgi:hypothetical protein